MSDEIRPVFVVLSAMDALTAVLIASTIRSFQVQTFIAEVLSDGMLNVHRDMIFVSRFLSNHLLLHRSRNRIVWKWEE